MQKVKSDFLNLCTSYWADLDRNFTSDGQDSGEFNAHIRFFKKCILFFIYILNDFFFLNLEYFYLLSLYMHKHRLHVKHILGSFCISNYNVISFVVDFILNFKENCLRSLSISLKAFLKPRVLCPFITANDESDLQKVSLYPNLLKCSPRGTYLSYPKYASIDRACALDRFASSCHAGGVSRRVGRVPFANFWV